MSANCDSGVVYTPEELARLLKVGAGVIRSMCRRGELGYRVGRRHWRIPATTVRRKYPEVFTEFGPAAA